MSGLFTVIVQEARGLVATPADVDSLAVVMGCGSGSTGLSSFYLSGATAKSDRGYGDAVDTTCQIIEQVQPDGGTEKKPCALYTCGQGTAGSYGTIDTSGVTGTAVATTHAATHPYGTYEAYLRVVNGGLIGTSGITLVESLDAGRTVSNVKQLGTATNYTIADGNVRFDFSPASADLTALNTLINELFTDINAHVIDVAASLHGAADNADVVSGTTYPTATDTATRVARINAMRAAYGLHRVKTSGGVHNSADSTNVVTAPIATDDSTALMLALNLKAEYNLHCANSVAHTGTDSVNTTTSPAPSAGALVAGDIIRVRTIAPVPGTSDVDAAFVALAAASLNFGILVCDFACNAAMIAHLTTGQSLLKSAGKRVTILTRSRIPDAETAETDAAWNTSVSADMTSATTNSTVHVRAAYGLVTDAMTSRQYLRSDLQQFAADVVRVARSDNPDVPADRPMANFTLVDANGSLVGHDEGPRGASTGLSSDTLGNRFGCVQRLPDPTKLEEVYCTVPWVLYASDERIRNLPTRRIANALEREAVAVGNTGLGGKIRYYPATSTTPAQLTPGGLRAVQSLIFQKLSADFQNDIQNPNDASLNTGLVQVNPLITVSGGNLITIPVTLKPVVFGYLLELDITLAVQE